jgi:hypothetical protein
MPPVDAVLKRLLPELFRSGNAGIPKPSVPMPFADVMPMAAVYVGCREPSSASPLIHIHTVVVIGEFERVVMGACVGPDLGGVLLHRLGRKCGKGNSDAIEKSAAGNHGSPRTLHNGALHIIAVMWCTT